MSNISQEISEEKCETLVYQQSQVFQIYDKLLILRNHETMHNRSEIPYIYSFVLPINAIIKATVYKHFCGGTTIDNSQKTINNLLRNIGDIQKNAIDINLNLLSSIYILNIFSAIIACKIKEIKTQSPKY